jgi:uncharacterized protein YbaR (Trm112 family)
MDAALLELICCPLTHQSLRPAGPAEIDRANAILAEPVSEGLVREDGRIFYPIRHGIPLLVPEEGLSLD